MTETRSSSPPHPGAHKVHVCITNSLWKKFIQPYSRETHPRPHFRKSFPVKHPGVRKQEILTTNPRTGNIHMTDLIILITLGWYDMNRLVLVVIQCDWNGRCELLLDASLPGNLPLPIYYSNYTPATHNPMPSFLPAIQQHIPPRNPQMKSHFLHHPASFDSTDHRRRNRIGLRFIGICGGRRVRRGLFGGLRLFFWRWDWD